MSDLVKRIQDIATNVISSLSTFSITDSYNGFVANYVPAIPSIETVIQRILHFLWVYGGLPLTKIIIISTLFSTIAGISAYAIRKMLIPNAVMNEII